MSKQNIFRYDPILRVSSKEPIRDPELRSMLMDVLNREIYISAFIDQISSSQATRNVNRKIMALRTTT